MNNNYPHEIEAIINGILDIGSAKYNPGYWRTVRVSTHLHHAMNHLDQYYAETDDSEDHLAHALVRLVMAVIVRNANQEKEKTIADSPTPD